MSWLNCYSKQSKKVAKISNHVLSNDNTGLWGTDMHALSDRQAKRFCLSVCHLNQCHPLFESRDVFKGDVVPPG